MPESLEGRALGPDWRVATHSTTELVLEQQNPGGARRVGGAMVVSFGALIVALALAFATPEDARLITWPLSAVLLVVAALGVPAALRNFQRARLGVRLRISREGAEGWPVTLTFKPRRVGRAEIARVAVQVFPHPPLSLAIFEVVLTDGSRLTGPEVAVATGERHPLGQIEAAARHLLASES
jgi:hypothetical protein